jgi:acetolactate synthase-1/2/3 large subunit
MIGIDALVEFLKESSSPLILMGAGARRSSPEIIAFAEKYNIPIETTWNAIDLIEWEHRLFVGRPGIVATRAANKALQECDLLISIGARLDPQTIAFRYDKLAPRAKKVLVDIDPAEALKIPNLDLYIEGDAGEFIRELDSLVKLRYTFSWSDICVGWKKKYGAESNTISYQLCDQLSDILTSNDVLVLSTTGMVGGSIFPAFFRQKKGQRVILSSCGLGSMGAGIPSAIGASLASHKRVVCIDGDGSFMQNVQELEVVRRLNLPITFFVINNGGYASIRSSEERAFGRHEEGMTFPNIQSIAMGFGIMSVIYHPEILESLLKWSRPLIVEVVAPHDEILAPRVNAMDKDGGLENMWPYLKGE